MADFIEGDIGAKVRMTFSRKSDGSVVDLAGCTVTFRLSLANQPALERSGTVLLPTTDGTAEYAFQTGELVAGSLEVQGTVTQGGVVLSTGVANLTVGPRLA